MDYTSHTQSADDDTNTSNQTKVIIAVVAFILGLAVGFISADKQPFVQSTDNENGGFATTTEEEADQVDPALVAATSTSVLVPNQVAGESVSVSSIRIDQTGWVTVYEDTNGEPGSILGAQLIEAGDWSGSITLLRATTPDATYYVKLLNENGDREFDHAVDLPLTNAEGEDIQATFQTYPASPR